MLIKHGNRPRKPSSCRSRNMPCFQVVSYAFSRSKKMATTCSFLIKACLTKVSNFTKWSTVEFFLRNHSGRRTNGPRTPGTTSVVRSPCAPWSYKDSWLARWACSLWDSWDLYLLWLWEPRLLLSTREGRFRIPNRVVYFQKNRQNRFR